jgi:hypothetical protein
MIFHEDEDGELLPITRDDLVRVWRWQKGQLRSSLILASDQAKVIEAHQRDGWHAWATAPLMTVGG